MAALGQCAEPARDRWQLTWGSVTGQERKLGRNENLDSRVFTLTPNIPKYSSGNTRRGVDGRMLRLVPNWQILMPGTDQAAHTDNAHVSQNRAFCS
jgi:hypothetical protein